jgi:hypothetical protein
MQQNSLIPYLEKCVEACNKCTSHLKSIKGNTDSEHSILSQDCGDICALTAKMIARRSEYTKNMIKSCVELCDACEEACSGMRSAECKNCADACRTCADECLKFISINML